ncbi:MAG: DUF4359 domain-containing protein [Thermaerobacter sp.]|nr:DUF4359 domain-containing protein [Thermaerobacter sp.]
MKYVKWAVLLAVAVTLAVSNPSSQSYSVWLLQTVLHHSSSTLSSISTLFSGSLESAIRANTIRANYVLFSYYTTHILGHTFNVVGVFNHFFALSNS